MIQNLSASQWSSPQEIKITDEPEIQIPAYYNLPATQALGVGPLQSVSLAEYFQTQISVGISTSGPIGAVLGNVYTELATADWYWNGSASVDSNFAATFSDAAGVFKPTHWTIVTSGQQYPTNLRTANYVGNHVSRWLPLSP